MSTPQNEIKAGIATAQADATKVAADVTAAKVAVVSADNKAIAWVKANPGKVVLILVAAALVLAWKIL